MARPRSEDRRDAIMVAATRIIAAQGLGAPTALIAAEAGVSNGSLFTYFETKADLLNQLYVGLKTEMAAAALQGVAGEGDARAQMEQMWSGWVSWAVSAPEKRRALAHLAVSDDITPQSQQIARHAMAGVAALLDRARSEGPLRDAPLSLVANLLNALADATIDFMIRDPAEARAHGRMAFEAMWRMLA